MTPATLAAAFLAAASAVETQPDTLPVAEIRAGMRCEGRTVYRGEEIETFDCEILGVLPGAWGPGEDVIVARLLGKNAERYGVVAGMSGSPVFVDGKLIGALSLAYGAFQKEAIAGITPIESMLRVRGSRGWPGAAPAGGTPQSASHELIPIRTPLALSGFAPEGVEAARSLFAPYGFVTTAGGDGSRGDVAAAARIRPGGAVSGLLVEGDVQIAATGTVTWRNGDEVLAFGHSFLLYGDVEMPMGAAEIVATVPSSALSFKLGRTTGVVGSVVRDNRTAIAGRIGRAARMIPVTVRLPEGSVPREVRFRVFRNRTLTAPMTAAAVVNSLVGNAVYDAEGTVRLDGRIAVDGLPDVTLSRTYFDPGAGGSAIPSIAGELLATLQRLFDNELAPAQVERVELAFGVEKGRRESSIDAAWAERTEVRAGETVGVRVRLRPYRGPVELREVRMRVPEGTPPGPLTIQVGDARYFEAKDRVTPPPNAGPPKSDDLRALIAVLNQRRAEDFLYVRLARASAGATIRGVPMPALPPSALGVVRGAEKGAGGAEPLGESVVDEVKMSIGGRVVGSAELGLKVVP